VLLFEILLKQGYSLTESVRLVPLAGTEVFSIGDGLVIAYLDQNVKLDLDAWRSIVASNPSKLIVLEDSFQGDDEIKTNLVQLCKSKSIEFWTA
jgi:adenine-specific DNA-methyltransferase